jgi:hypothetical protein
MQGPTSERVRSACSRHECNMNESITGTSKRLETLSILVNAMRSVVLVLHATYNLRTPRSIRASHAASHVLPPFLVKAMRLVVRMGHAFSHCDSPVAFAGTRPRATALAGGREGETAQRIALRYSRY